MRASLVALAGLAGLSAAGDTQPVLEEVRVVALAPADATGLPPELAPRHVQWADAAELRRSQSIDLTDYLTRRFAGVTANFAQGNPLQPDLRFRGYTASPLLGLPQGLAVYLDGARINEPLGDTVNWDLLPESAVQTMSLAGGADPLFGPNSLGGALALEMKNGFDFRGHQGEIYGGDFGRAGGSLESGGNDGTLGYYVNLSRFDEDGWRDQSPSELTTAYAGVSLRSGGSRADLGLHYGDSELVGNGTAPVGLLAKDRAAVFTAPDITANEVAMVTLKGAHAPRPGAQIAASAFYRDGDTRAFNGDASEYTLCRLGNGLRLLEGLDDEAPGADQPDPAALCDGASVADAEALEALINLPLEDLTPQLSGTGELSDEAVNNHSTRSQTSRGLDLQLMIESEPLDRSNRLLVGVSHYRGDSRFLADVELAGLNPLTRSTASLGTGTYVEGAATRVDTRVRTRSVYLSDTLSLNDTLAVTVSGRYDDTRVTIRDLSGGHPELDGRHRFRRFNPFVGLTWQPGGRVSVYASYGESSRAPTPIELTCNESVFEAARQRTATAGGDPDDVDFECRLPNAFVADPPLDQVVARSVELGARGGVWPQGGWHLGLFRSTNEDDIVFQSSGRATGLFGQIDATRRQGLEGAVSGRWRGLDWFASYTYLRATFEDRFAATSPAHPFADPDGTLPVEEGDRIPATPTHHLKVGGDWSSSAGLAFGGEVLYQSGQYLRGDPVNLLAPLDGFTVVNLRAGYAWSEHLELFARLDNALDTRYESFGLLGEDPGDVLDGLTDTRPRYLAPGPPRAAWVGLRVRLVPRHGPPRPP